MLLVRVIKNNEIYLFIFLGQVKLSKGLLCPEVLGKGLELCPIGLEPPAGAGNRKKHLPNLFLIE